MIKFFRRIRRDLISENSPEADRSVRAGKFSKYLLYAIGEIALVVIGILIALQINNANENHKLNKTRQNYYRQILADLNIEIENLQSRIDRLDRSITTYETYKDVFESPNLELLQVIEALGQVDLTFAYLSFNTNTVETLESTGDIKLIPANIRNKLIELKRSQEIMSTASAGNDATYLNAQQKAMQLGFSPIARRLANQPLIERKLKIDDNLAEIILTLEAAYGLKNYSERERIIVFRAMLEDVKEIKDLISQELES